MKKRLLVIFNILIVLFISKSVYAFDSNNYSNKSLCGTYEVAGFHSNGKIDPVYCSNSFDDAKNWMVSDGADDLGILSRVGGSVRIVDANVALMDLSVNPDTLTYFYTNSDLSGSSYTYMDTGSLYGGVDGAHIDSLYNSNGVLVSKVRIGNFTGWIKYTTYEIVPITWVKSSSSYTITNSYIKHNYVSKIQNVYNGSRGSIIGPKPDGINTGTYYSYDGHYFYNNLITMIKDYKKGVYSSSINKNNPYYNYYMYLSNHTKTNYSSVNIDEYIRNNMGISMDAYGNASSGNHTSRLYGSGVFFYYAQQRYGVNALLSLSLSRNETGNGRSYLSVVNNNGFGLGAVDSNPIKSAKWYPSFADSILGYASHWITENYASATDWKYFGPQFGDKFIGMNVKYASDTYWSEKMAANYYSIDNALGMQDYNYYQLGVVTGPTPAYSSPNGRLVYTYPEAEDGVVIVGERNVGGTLWYEVMCDLNVDANYNRVSGKDYDWSRTVYVRASQVKKINKGRNGYVSPNSVPNYLDSNYTYDLLINNSEKAPLVGLSSNKTNYYYDSSLTSRTGKSLLKGRYVVIHSIAYNGGVPVSYLVSSDYFHNQMHWVKASDIKIVSVSIGHSSVTEKGNCYTWVNYNTVDDKSSLISGLYTDTYVPVVDSIKVGGNTWYKVPVDLTGDSKYEYGYTLASAKNVNISLSSPIIRNSEPVINAYDIEIMEGDKFNLLDGVKASDAEDGDITSKIKVVENNVNTDTPGTYKVVYEVEDSKGSRVSKTISVIVNMNEAPVISASDIKLVEGDSVDVLDGVKASDAEDGDLTSKIKVVENTIKTDTPGIYKVVYEVEDSKGKKTTYEVRAEVSEDKAPIIDATDVKIVKGDKFNALDGVRAIDAEDGDLTDKIKVISNDVDISKIGKYRVEYQVTDSHKNKTVKEIVVEVISKEEKEDEESDVTEGLTKEDGEFYLKDLSWNKSGKYFTIDGYLIILGQDNSLTKKYQLVLQDISSSKEYSVDIDSWIKDVPFELGSENGHDYNNSWFKGKLDLSHIPNGDYRLFIRTYDDKYYSEEVLDNILNTDISHRGEDSKHGYNFKVQFRLKSRRVDLSIRDELYTACEPLTYRNMSNEFDEIKFSNDKLYMIGYAYDYGASYDNLSLISKKMIVEDTTTFKQYYYNLKTVTGPFTITTADNKSKKYAWYEDSIDISNLDKGTYSVWIYSKTGSVSDYSELTDMFKSLNISNTINGKKYRVTYNKNRLNRIEIIVS